MIDTKQAVDPIGPAVDPINLNEGRIRRLLYKRAKDKARSRRWNINALMFVCATLITVIILTILSVNSLIVALVAISGLMTSWLYTWLRLRKLERQFYQQEMFIYGELLSSEPRDNFNEEETLGSLNSTTTPLTKRELEILSHMAASQSNKQIAYALGISQDTVKNHASNIYGKLEVYDRTSAVILALRHGWIKYGPQQADSKSEYSG